MFFSIFHLLFKYPKFVGEKHSVDLEPSMVY